MDPEIELKDFSSDEGMIDEDFLAYHQHLSDSFTRFRKRVLLAAAVLLCLAVWSLVAITYPSLHRHSDPADATNGPARQALFPQKPAFTHQHQSIKARRDLDVCNTTACLDFADVIKNNLARNYTRIDPCTNFPEYVCGGWKDTQFSGEGMSSPSQFSLLAKENNVLARAIIERGYADFPSYVGATSEANRDNFNTLRAAYDACMDDDALKRVGREPLNKLLHDLPKIYNGPDAKNSSRDMTDALIYLARLDVFPLLHFGPDRDAGNPDVVSIHLDPPHFGLLSSKFHSRRAVPAAAYANAMSAMFTSVDEDEDEDEDKMRDLLEYAERFKSATAEAQADPEVAADPMYYYNVMSFAEIDGLLPEVSLTRLIRAFLPAGYEPKHVIVRDPLYFERVKTNIFDLPNDILQAFFAWQLVDGWVEGLSDDDVNAIRDFEAEIEGGLGAFRVPRWKVCMKEIRRHLPLLEASFWAQSQVAAEDMDLANRIVDDVQDAYVRRFDTNDWMDDRDRVNSKQKLQNMKKNVGYPTVSPNVMNPVAVQQRHASLQLSDNDHFGNILRLVAFESEAYWNQLTTRVDKDQWDGAVPGVGAYYHPVWNQLTLPAGLMRRPIFDSQLPDYVSYGGFGMIAGHEMAHAFDIRGSQYNENGAWRTWWGDSTRREFDDFASCILRQYSRYEVDFLVGGNETIDGNRTLPENMADTLGLSMAYGAWAKRSGQSPSALLPNLPPEISSLDRLFFVSFATTWCDNPTDEELTAALENDIHSPSRYRVIGSLANSKEFREAFNCPAEMHTCELF